MASLASGAGNFITYGLLELRHPVPDARKGHGAGRRRRLVCVGRRDRHERRGIYASGRIVDLASRRVISPPMRRFRPFRCCSPSPSSRALPGRQTWRLSLLFLLVPMFL
ncbi:hypothetical protein ACRAWD_22860 [Caulobacter segnis]